MYTWDIFSTLDGHGSFTESADWGGKPMTSSSKDGG
jgi:hypothetical protein